MTRQQVKLKAKEDIRGRVFVCFMPFLILFGIQILFDALLIKNTYGVLPVLINIGMYPINVGIAKIYMRLVEDKTYTIKLGEIFSFYKSLNKLGDILLSYIVSTVFIVLGTICFLVPGIILAMRYSMLPFVLADYDDISWRDALKKCKEITDGRKGEIFVYYLSFIGWMLLIIITLSIASIYVIPYMQATFANLYYVYNPKPVVEYTENNFYL